MIMTEETGRKLTATTFFFSKQTIKKKKLKKGGKFCHWISLADLHMYRWHTGDGADLWPNGQPAAYSGRLSSYRSSCLSEQRTRNVVLSLHWKNLAATPERCFFFQIVWCTSRASCLYSSEISSYGANPETEKVPPHVCMLKKVPIKTPNDTVYGELSRLPIACVIYDQMCEVLVQTPRAAWSLLFEEILSNICSLAQEGKIKWTSCIKLLLSQTGFAEIRLYVNVVLVMEACSWKSEEKDYVLVFVTAGSVV